MRVGVLALQGDFIEHEQALARIGVETVQVRPFHAVFIRAPIVERVESGVEVLARLEDGTVVAARQGNLLATTFHPELVDDDRFHRYFVGLSFIAPVSDPAQSVVRQASRQGVLGWE